MDEQTSNKELLGMTHYVDLPTGGKFYPEDHPWPEEVRIGSGARTIALLNNVPVGYELWRQLNGFPPEYYKPEATKTPKLPIKIK